MDSNPKSFLKFNFRDLVVGAREGEDPEIEIVLESNTLSPSFALMFGKNDFQGELDALKKEAEKHKSIWGRTLYGKDVGWKCLTCELDSWSVLCANWFNKGNC